MRLNRVLNKMAGVFYFDCRDVNIAGRNSGPGYFWLLENIYRASAHPFF